MARKRTSRRSSSDPLEAYRRVRKPMPPPERIIPDDRRATLERQAEREAEREALEAMERDAGERDG